MGKVAYVLVNKGTGEVLLAETSFKSVITVLRRWIMDDPQIEKFSLSAWVDSCNQCFCEISIHPDAGFTEAQLSRQVNKVTLEKAMDESSTILVV